MHSGFDHRDKFIIHLTYANRYSIKEWSHSNTDKEYFGNDQIIFEEFVKAVNIQDAYPRNRFFSIIII